MRHDRAKSSCFEFIGVEKECYEMERAINKTETKREENKRSGRGERERERQVERKMEGVSEDNVRLSSKISKL